MNQHLHRFTLCLKPERNGIPTTARVQSLNRNHTPIRSDGNVEPLLLCTRASHHEGDGVVHALDHLDSLLDGGLVP